MSTKPCFVGSTVAVFQKVKIIYGGIFSNTSPPLLFSGVHQSWHMSLQGISNLLSQFCSPMWPILLWLLVLKQCFRVALCSVVACRILLQYFVEQDKHCYTVIKYVFYIQFQGATCVELHIHCVSKNNTDIVFHQGPVSQH